MKKKILVSIVLVAAWLFFATLFYKTLCVMLLYAVWSGWLMSKIPEGSRRWAIRAVWVALIVVLWVAMPRYRIHSTDRVRLLYVDKDWEVQRPPLSHWLLSTLVPEAEVVNVGISGIRLMAPAIKQMGIGPSLIQQAQDDIKDGKIRNFFKPYRRLGLDNPISGVYPQMFNEKLGTDYAAFYLCRPRHYDSERTYPIVVFCHGYMGNWQLCQGIWKDLDEALVLSIGTRDLSGIFGQQDINSIFDAYIPMLERMGYHVDHNRVHLMGLSNGGSAINAAMHSRHAKDFKSITSLSCNLDGLRRVPCRVNLVGGGRDGSSSRMPRQHRELRRMGVDAALFFDEADNHYILVKQRKAILNFLRERMDLSKETR